MLMKKRCHPHSEYHKLPKIWGWRVSPSNHCYNFPKMVIRHSWPLHTAVKRCETSLSLSRSLSFFILHYFCHFLCEQRSATPWMSSRRDSLQGCAVIFICLIHPVSSLTAGFWCGHSEPLWTLVPLEEFQGRSWTLITEGAEHSQGTLLIKSF